MNFVRFLGWKLWREEKMVEKTLEEKPMTYIMKSILDADLDSFTLGLCMYRQTVINDKVIYRMMAEGMRNMYDGEKMENVGMILEILDRI